MNALNYLLQVNLYLIIFYGLYLLILRNETFFKLNRLYLLSSVLLALAIPTLKAEWVKDLFVTEQVYRATQQVSSTVNSIVIDESVYSDQDLAPAQNINLTAGQVFWMFYGAITLFFICNFIRKLYLVNRALKGSVKHQAFSFFNKVVVDEELQGKETIMDHEMVHVKQFHSLDVIFFELFAAFNWFNPIAFLYKKAIKNIHEFIADETAASILENKSEYALLLVSNAFGTQPHKLTNSFYNNSLLKRRLIMLNKNKSRKTAILKYGLSVPLFAVMVIFSSATIEKSEAVQDIANKIEESIPVVVEAITNQKLAVEQLDENEVNSLALSNIDDSETSTIISKDERLFSEVSKHFMKSIKYIKSDQEAKLTGTTFLTFELDEAGAIKNSNVLKAMSAASSAEVTRVLKSATPFGKGLKGKYLTSIKYTLYGVSDDQPLYDYSNDLIDLSDYEDHKVLNEIVIRGYLSKVSSNETERLDQLRLHFLKNVRYPTIEFSNNITGVNYLTFEMDNMGKINNPVFIKSVSENIKLEIERVLATAPAFGAGAPGKYILPVIFTLTETDMPVLQNSFPGISSSEYQYLKPIVSRGYSKLPLVEVSTDVSLGPKTKDGRQLFNVKTTVKNNPVESMQQHLHAFKNKPESDIKNGIVYIAFDVSADKFPGNYRIVKSEKAKWGKDLLAHFTAFKDTVGLAPGSYYFFMNAAYGSEYQRAKTPASVERLNLAFGLTNTIAVTTTVDSEKEDGISKPVNYIQVPYLKKPIILVDGNVATYKITKKGFKLDKAIYPKEATTRVFQGNKAVENYNETARKSGLIVITTKQP